VKVDGVEKPDQVDDDGDDLGVEVDGAVEVAVDVEVELDVGVDVGVGVEVDLAVGLEGDVAVSLDGTDVVGTDEPAAVVVSVAVGPVAPDVGAGSVTCCSTPVGPAGAWSPRTVCSCCVAEPCVTVGSPGVRA
jgi:hypothetical protein